MCCLHSFVARWHLNEIIRNTLPGTNISPEKSILKKKFLFPRWDMLISWRVHLTVKENMNVSLGVFCEWDLLQVSINRMCPSPQGYGAYLHGLLWFHLVYCSIQFWWGRKVVNIKKPWSHKGVFPEIVGFPPNHPFFIGVFHYFHHPFWGYPYFWKHP